MSPTSITSSGPWGWHVSPPYILARSSYFVCGEASAAAVVAAALLLVEGVRIRWRKVIGFRISCAREARGFPDRTSAQAALGFPSAASTLGRAKASRHHAAA